jgi:primosomal protein N' (replication factor Y)
MLIAQVIVDIKSYNVDKIFDYIVPEAIEIAVGMRVKVPFGARTLDGYVIHITNQSTLEGTKLKPLLGVSSVQFLNEELIALATFFAEQTASFKTSMLQAMLPKDVTKRKVKTVEVVTELKKRDVPLRAKKQRAVLDYLSAEALPVSLPSLRKQFGAQVVAKMIQDDFFLTQTVTADSLIVADETGGTHSEVTLRAEQAEVLAALKVEEGQPFLLKGVTGSGKTEVFLRYVEYVLTTGKTALILVPEIGLTPQMIARFSARFGASRLAILHSKLSQADRFEAWVQIKKGKRPIVLGTRSAIFAPLENIGVIILDEEHDTSYKQENMPTYSAKDVALWRSEYHKAKVIFASATPSLESYVRAEKSVYRLLELKERVLEAPHEIEIVNMRHYLGEERFRYFSPDLLTAMEAALAAGQQIILLLNRRGYAPLVQCHTCGHTAICVHCDTNLVYHKAANRFICHYCQYVEAASIGCPMCHGALVASGIGVEKIAEELTKIFPQATFLQADRDHIKTLADYERIYNAFNKREAQILLGTQMVAKGFDFPNVSVVGVLETDQILHLPDVRAREKAFQLLTQVIGRAGRGLHQGRAFLQTYEPEHELFATIVAADYDAFARGELASRQQFHNPPFWHMSDIIIAAGELHEASRCANVLYEMIQPLERFATIYAPAPTFIKKVNNRYQLHILLKYKDSKLVVRNVKKAIEQTAKDYPQVRTYLQVNPLTFN